MRIVLAIAGAVTLILAVLWWPMGYGEYSADQALVARNYEKLVESGAAPENPSAMSVLWTGMEPRSASRRSAEAAFLLLTAALELGGAWAMHRSKCRAKSAEEARQ